MWGWAQGTIKIGSTKSERHSLQKQTMQYSNDIETSNSTKEEGWTTKFPLATIYYQKKKSQRILTEQIFVDLEWGDNEWNARYEWISERRSLKQYGPITEHTFDVTENIIFHQKQYPKYQKDLLRQTTEYFSWNITLKCQTRRTSKKRKGKRREKNGK